MGIAVITGVALLLAGVAEGVILGRQKRWGELAVASMIWLFAAGYAFFVVAPFEVPTPARLIADVMLSLQNFLLR